MQGSARAACVPNDHAAGAVILSIFIFSSHSARRLRSNDYKVSERAAIQQSRFLSFAFVQGSNDQENFNEIGYLARRTQSPGHVSPKQQSCINQQPAFLYKSCVGKNGPHGSRTPSEMTNWLQYRGLLSSGCRQVESVTMATVPISKEGETSGKLRLEIVRSFALLPSLCVLRRASIDRGFTLIFVHYFSAPLSALLLLHSRDESRPQRQANNQLAVCRGDRVPTERNRHACVPNKYHVRGASSPPPSRSNSYPPFFFFPPVHVASSPRHLARSARA